MSDTENKVHLEQARIAHEHQRKDIADQFAAVSSFGNAAMRAPALASAAGIAGILGFYSANSALIKGMPAAADFTAALVWFFGSILLCVLAPGLAWLSQGFFLRAITSQKQDWAHPYVHDTAASRNWKRAGTILQIATVISVILAISFLTLGAYRFYILAVNLAAKLPN